MNFHAALAPGWAPTHADTQAKRKVQGGLGSGFRGRGRRSEVPGRNELGIWGFPGGQELEREQGEAGAESKGASQGHQAARRRTRTRERESVQDPQGRGRGLGPGRGEGPEVQDRGSSWGWR